MADHTRSAIAVRGSMCSRKVRRLLAIILRVVMVARCVVLKCKAVSLLGSQLRPSAAAASARARSTKLSALLLASVVPYVMIMGFMLST